jgi:hypothetical protein
MRVHKVPDPTCPIRTNAKKSQDKSNQAKDQSLLDCVGVYLKRLGWSERARRTQYQLNLNGSLLIIPRDRMLRIVTDMHIHGELDEFTAGRIEEELLISKVERQIQVSTMVKNSYQNAQYDNDNVNQRITGRRKHDDQYHFDVSSDNCDVDHPRYVCIALVDTSSLIATVLSIISYMNNYNFWTELRRIRRHCLQIVGIQTELDRHSRAEILNLQK